MKFSRMSFRFLWIRVIHEWRRFGRLNSLILRIVEIVRSEGWPALRKRLNNLTKCTPLHALVEGAQMEGAMRGVTPGTAAIASGVQLIGHPYGILGVGENLRSIATALASADIQFDISSAFPPHSQNSALLQEFPFSERVVQDGRHHTNLFCLNANEMDMALSYLGPDIFERHYNIGCWMWELSEFPGQWTTHFRYVQEIWAQSRFVQEAIAKKSPVPVIWMPQVVEPGVANPDIVRTLGVPSDIFTFLFFFDFTSYIARKNPMAVVRAFRLAFDKNAKEPVALVIKMNGSDKRSGEYRRLLNDIGNPEGHIILIDKILSDHEIKGLISGCDVFVSLHRSEGFGRGIAEAMYYGKPTIATGYSGNMDFTNHFNCCLVDYTLVPVRKGEYPYWRGQFWADPDVTHAARWMRQLYEDRGLCDVIGKRAGESIRGTHGAVVAGARMRERLSTLGLI